jgi:hypothetical protein
MEEVLGPMPLPDAKWHRPEKEYVLSLLQRSRLSQRGAARVLGINERTMRYYCSGEQPTPYLVQYALEVLARQGSQEPPPAQTWHDAKDRPLEKRDAGQIVVGYDKHGTLLAGELVEDEFGVSIRSSSGVGAHMTPADVVERYALLSQPLP